MYLMCSMWPSQQMITSLDSDRPLQQTQLVPFEVMIHILNVTQVQIY
jgi:hypothetical protein